MKKFLWASALLLASIGSADAGENPFVGEIETFGFSFCPRGWLPTNGAILPISNYQVLYALLGTQYGGDGISNFGLPNTQPIFTKTRATFTQCIAYLGIFPSQN